MLIGGCKNDGDSSTNSSTPAPAASTKTSTSSAKIDINVASIAELDKLELPGTKPSLSERIQGGRPYRKPEDLVSKKVISQSEFNLIKNLITVSDKK